MPIYEYECSECGNIFEVLTTSSTNENEAQCDKCKSNQVKKVISAGTFRLTPGVSSAPPAGCGRKSGFS